MDKEVVKSAIGGVDALLSKAKRALREIEFTRFGGWDNEGSYESPEDAMVWHLHQLHDHLLVILEAAGMPEARAHLIARWGRSQSSIKASDIPSNLRSLITWQARPSSTSIISYPPYA